jgi:segregation and condensation protein A
MTAAASMSYHVTTEVFAGPLDLLLSLINRHQVDITGLSLADLVSEYLRYLDEIELDLDLTSEFLLIAATLIQLKAHRLLPSGAEPDLDEELALMEERDRLLSRLLMCVTFKDVAAVLLARLQETARLVPRISGLDQVLNAAPPPFELPVDLAGLAALAGRVLQRAAAEPDLDHLDLDLPSVEAAISDLTERVTEAVAASFEDLIAHCRRRVEVAAYFLALLELARWGLVELHQPEWLAPIEVRRRDTLTLEES